VAAISDFDDFVTVHSPFSQPAAGAAPMNDHVQGHCGEARFLALGCPPDAEDTAPGSLIQLAPLGDASRVPASAAPIELSARLLMGLPLFAGLTSAQAEDLATRSTLRHYARGQWVIRQGDQDNALFVFLGGRALRVRTDARGREVVLSRLGTGDHVGDMSLIDGRPHSSAVRCEERCTLLVVPGSVFAACMARMPRLAEAMMQSLVARLRFSHRRISSLALDETKERVARWLHEMCSEVDGCYIIQEKVSRQQLGRTIGASREMVSRVMTEMAANKLIETLSNGFIVLNYPPPNERGGARPR
jgi:CRP/FNR family transcriptional regulator, cyclic AMP receptor protein